MTSEIVFFHKKYCEYGWTPKYLKPTGWVRTINSTKNGVTIEKYRQIEVKTFIFFRRWVNVHTVNWTYKATETVQIVKGFDPTNVEDVKRIFGGPENDK